MDSYSNLNASPVHTSAGAGFLSMDSLQLSSGFFKPHRRTDLHIARKVWHMGMGLMIVGLYLTIVARPLAILLLGTALGIILTGEVIRLRIPLVNEKLIRLTGAIIRKSEVNRMSGIPFYVGAALFSIAVFPKTIAVLSILFLACGDPIASVFGILYGKYSVRFSNGKSLIGTAAGIVTCALVSVVFLKASGLSGLHVLILSLIGGVAGGAAEMLPIEVDDNFSIPIVSGFALWLGYIFLGI
jgi:diacylglycerol kinase (CTP)